MPSRVEEIYPHTVSVLKSLLGDKYTEIESYLHIYDGTRESVKPVAKHITIYYIGKTADWLMIRTEGADDIVAADVKGKGVPALLFRKFKAKVLRDFVSLLRDQWNLHSEKIKSIDTEIYGSKYDYLDHCSISPGVESGKKGVMQNRCMKCPADVLLGAVGKEKYNLVSRYMGDTAYALSPLTQRMTGNSIDEVTRTPYIPKKDNPTDEEGRTGALFSEQMVPPNTMFIGKVVLFMPSPPELLYALYLMPRTLRLGARQTTRGTMEVEPVVVIGDLFEVGNAHTAAEHAFGIKDKAEVREKLSEYLSRIVTRYTKVVEVTPAMLEAIRKTDILAEPLVLELWRNSANFIKGVNEYIKVSKSKEA